MSLLSTSFTRSDSSLGYSGVDRAFEVSCNSEKISFGLGSQPSGSVGRFDCLAQLPHGKGLYYNVDCDEKRNNDGALIPEGDGYCDLPSNAKPHN